MHVFPTLFRIKLTASLALVESGPQTENAPKLDRKFKQNRWPHRIPRVSDSVGPRWSLSIFLSNKFPGNVDNGGPEATA